MQGTLLRLLEGSHLPLILVGTNDRIVWHNRSAAELFHFDLRQLNGGLAPFKAADKQRQITRANDGREFEIEVISIPMEFEDVTGRCSLCIIQEPGPTAPAPAEAWYQRETPFRVLVDSAPEGVVFSRNLKIIYANRKFVDIYGLEGEITGQPIVDLVAPEEVPQFLMRTSQRELGYQQDGAYELKAQRRDGKQFRVSAAVARIDLEDGPATVGFFRDVTGQREALDALAEREELLRHAFDSSITGMALVAIDGSWIRVNPALCDMLGYNSGEMLQISAQALTHKDDLEAKLNLRKEIADGTRKSYQLEQRYLHKDGRIIWVNASVAGVCNSGGELLYFVHQVQDITERKRVEGALRESERRLSMAISATADAIWEWNVETGHAYYSPRWYEMLGYANLQLPMNVDTWMSLCHPGDFVAATDPIRVRRAGSKNKAFETDIQMRHQDGNWRWIKVRGSVVEYDPTGQATVISGTNTEITAQKRLEEQLTQAHKMEAIGRLAGGVAHDFNNLLTVINGYSELSLRQLKLDDPLRHRLEEIRKAGERAAGLTSQLLAFSRKQVLQPRALNLNTVVMDMESMLRRLVGEDVEISLTLCGGRPMLRADQHQLEQVIMNLAVNARDAMPAGGRLAIETEVSLHEARPHGWFSNADGESGRYAVLAVSDSGAGMDEATRERIFEPFFTTKGAGQGTGLGLSMVQGIVEQSGGFIEVDSTKGEGTTFRIFLPALAEVASAIPSAAAALAEHGSETILVVEDQEFVRDYVVNVLTAYGYNVVQAADGDDALAICRREDSKIHLLLTDVVMPHMSGAELGTHIAELGTGIKILCMSGYTDKAFGHNGKLDETVNFIQKPFTPEELAAKVREVLG